MDEYFGGLIVAFMCLAVFFGLGWWAKAESVATECKEYKVITTNNVQIPCNLKDQNAK